MSCKKSHKIWTEQEKEMFKELHEKHEEECWNHISNHIEGRRQKDAR
jgi:hypothetical protein